MLHTLKRGKAAGPDGIIHELWIELENKYVSTQKNGGTSFDIVKALTIVYNDIQDHRIEVNSGFAEGWLCPIYKKGNKIDIGN